jgi:hypothetical protein
MLVQANSGSVRLGQDYVSVCQFLSCYFMFSQVRSGQFSLLQDKSGNITLFH